MLRDSNPELKGHQQRCQFLATQQNANVSSLTRKHDYVRRRLTIVDKYISINHPFDTELIDILSIPQKQTHNHPKSRCFSTIKDKKEQVNLLKEELEQVSLRQDVPENEKFLYLAKKLNTSERTVRTEFVHMKAKECKEKQITVCVFNF